MKADHRFIEGLKLFNTGDYFECHEVIEDLWLEVPSEDPCRDLYKGVIQAAAAMYQWERGILTGARGLYGTSKGYLERYRPESLGLNVEKLLSEMKIFFEPFETWDGVSVLPYPAGSVPVLEYKVSSPRKRGS